MKKHLLGVILVVVMIAGAQRSHAQDIADSFGSPLPNAWTTYLDDSTYDFGDYVASWNGYHAGVDTSVNETPTGTNVFASGNGIVRFAGLASGYGNNGGSGYAIVIEHTLIDGGHILSLYGHIQNGSYNAAAKTGIVTAGTVVTKGQYIGKIADYLWNGSNWHHLHYGVQPGSYDQIGQTAALRGYESTQDAIGENWWNPTDLLAEENAIIFADTPPGEWYLSALNDLYALEVISGYDAEPGMFGPENTITRAELCKMVVGGMNEKEPGTYILDGHYEAATFTDVTVADWFYDSVMVLAEADVVNGYGDGTFGPNDPVTRDQTAKIVANGFSLNDETWGDAPWSDFTDGENLFDEALSLYAYAVMNGYGDGTFSPEKNLTRGEAAEIIARALTAITLRVDPN